MRKLGLFTIVLFSFLSSFAQPITGRSSSSVTVSDERWQGHLNMFAPRYVDTTAANLQKGIDSCGAIIFTYDVNGLWERKCSPKRWEQLGGGGANNSWSILGNSGTVDGTNFIGTTDNVPFNIRVNNQKAGRIDNSLSNVYYGTWAGNNNSIGYQNTAIGESSLYYNTGTNNTAIGFNSSIGNTTGIGNTGIGSQTLSSNPAGSYNVGIGVNADVISGNNGIALGQNSIAIGNQFALSDSIHSLKFHGVPSGTNYVLTDTSGSGNFVSRPVLSTRFAVGGEDSIANQARVFDLNGNNFLMYNSAPTGTNYVEFTTLSGSEDFILGLGHVQFHAGGGGMNFNGKSLWVTNNNTLHGETYLDFSNIPTGVQTIKVPTVTHDSSYLVTSVDGNLADSTGNVPTFAWGINGNSGTFPSTNFIGTTDDAGLMFKTNGIRNGYLDYDLHNVSFGEGALVNINGSSRYNVSIGFNSANSLISSTGNTAIGYGSLGANIGGGGNTAIGESSLYTSTGGDDNTGIGNSATVANGINGSTAIGAGSYVGQDRSASIGDTVFFVGLGIGTAFPKGRLHVVSGGGSADPFVVEGLNIGSPTDSIVTVNNNGVFKKRNASSFGGSNNLETTTGFGNTTTHGVDIITGQLKTDTLSEHTASAGITFNNDVYAGKIHFPYQNGSTASTSGMYLGTSKVLLFRNDTTYTSDLPGGYSNIFLGKNAGNTSTNGGGGNIMLGDSTGSKITSGFANIGLGAFSLNKITSQNYNVALGYGSMQNSTGTGVSTAVGALTLTNNTSSTIQVAIGANALKANTSGGTNVAVGGSALLTNLTGSQNTAMGSNSLQNSTGSKNTANGHSSLAQLSSGDNNAGFGQSAGVRISTGSYNSYFGYYAGESSSITPTTQNYAGAFGAMANSSRDSNFIFGNTYLKGMGWGNGRNTANAMAHITGNSSSATASGSSYGKALIVDNSSGTNGLTVYNDASVQLNASTSTTTDTTTFKPLVLDASGNVKKSTYWPVGASTSVSAGYGTLVSSNTVSVDTTKIANRFTPLGTLYNSNSWASGADFTLVGSPTISYTGNKINVSGGNQAISNTLGTNNSAFNQVIKITAYGATTLERWRMYTRFKVNIAPGSTTYGLATGTYSISTGGSISNAMGYFNMSTNAGTGTGAILVGTGNNSASLSPTALTFSQNDYVALITERIGDRLFQTAKNITTGLSVVTTSYVYDPSSSSNILMPNTSDFAIANLGGSYIIDSISITSDEAKYANALFVGDSKLSGYATGFDVRIPALLNRKLTNVVVSSGQGDRTQDVLNHIAEIIALKPRQAIVCIGRNDIAGGVSTATWEANLSNIVSQLQSAGIAVNVLDAIYETNTNQATLLSYVPATFPNNYIGTYAPGSGTGTVATDGVHPNLLGAKIVADVIYNNLVLKDSGIYINSKNNNSALLNPTYDSIRVTTIRDDAGTYKPDTWNVGDHVFREGAALTSAFGSSTQKNRIVITNTTGANMEFRTYLGAAGDPGGGGFTWYTGRATTGTQTLGMKLTTNDVLTVGSATPHGFTSAAGDIGIQNGSAFYSASGTGAGSEGRLVLFSGAGHTELRNYLSTGEIRTYVSSGVNGTQYQAHTILPSGNEGVGVNAPTAILHLKAGTATAGTASLRLDSGIVNTTAVKGQVEFNGSFYQTKASALRYGVGGVIADFYTDVNNSSTTETDLYTYTTPARTLDATGEKLTATYSGTFNDITATGQLQLYFGGTSIGNTGTLTVSATGGWKADVFLIRTGSTTARAIVNISTPGASTAVYTTETDLTGLTFSNTNIIKITGTAGGAGGGSSDITAKLGTISWMPAANN